MVGESVYSLNLSEPMVSGWLIAIAGRSSQERTQILEGSVGMKSD